MTTWRYHIEEANPQTSVDIAGILNRLGSEGWELTWVSPTAQFWFFKRPFDWRPVSGEHEGDA